MQDYAETAARLGIEGHGAEAFADYLVAMGRAQGDDTAWERRGGEILVHQTTWRLMDSQGPLAPAVFDAWSELWRGAALAHDPHLLLDVSRRCEPASRAEWRLVRR